MYNELNKKLGRQLSRPHSGSIGEVRPSFRCQHCGEPARSRIDLMTHLIECGSTFISPDELFVLEDF